MSEHMMNTREVAEYLNINEKQVYKLIKEKNIPASRVTGKWTFPKNLIDEWVIQDAAARAGRLPVSKEPDRHLIAMGSNDFSIELLSRELTRKHPEFSMSIANVGSAGGLIALSRRICHLASSHLRDSATGEYNIPFLPHYLPNRQMLVVTVAERDVGLIVARGNPKNLQSVCDLARPGITVLNRQRGSGTRAFFDHELDRLGMDPAAINGYHTEVSTHLQAGLAVLSGGADAVVGIRPAAAMLNLDFLFLQQERFDLVIPHEYRTAAPFAALLSILRSAAFVAMLDKLGGYGTAATGREVSA